MDMSCKHITELEGQIFSQVFIGEHKETMTFQRNDKTGVQFSFSADCCEEVSIVDVCGSLDDLVNTPIVSAEIAESESGESMPFPEEVSTSFVKKPLDKMWHQWTFYRFRTIKGTVVVRWLGQVDGCYSLAVDMLTLEQATP